MALDSFQRCAAQIICPELDDKKPHAREALLSLFSKYLGITHGTTLNASPPQVSVPQMTPCESMMSGVNAGVPQPGVFCQLNTHDSVQPLVPGLSLKIAYSVRPHRLPLASKVTALGKSSAGSVKRLKSCKTVL